MAELDPKSNAKLEARKVLHDMEPGDALFMDRYCFHRGEPLVDSRQDQDLKLRYTFRYMPADARYEGLKNAPPAFMAMDGPLKDGDRLDSGGAAFPQVWPGVIDGEGLE
mmetsp:Transcript_45245/g.141798  ORF Transcript_45245/g.141798 Transcript_45245/m.141798 type:complete len:109 (+) Transcript_45245:532-858(+)